MHSVSVTYFDYEDRQRERQLWFHLSRKQFLTNLSLEDELLEAQAIFDAPEHELTTAEKQMILNLIIRVVRLSYGERSRDGELFDQSDEAWARFGNSAAYDEFLVGLFVPDPSKAFEFVTAVIPQKLRTEAIQSAESRQEPTNAELEKNMPTTLERLAEAEQQARFQQWLKEHPEEQ